MAYRDVETSEVDPTCLHDTLSLNYDFRSVFVCQKKLIKKIWKLVWYNDDGYRL